MMQVQVESSNWWHLLHQNVRALAEIFKYRNIDKNMEILFIGYIAQSFNKGQRSVFTVIASVTCSFLVTP